MDEIRIGNAPARSQNFWEGALTIHSPKGVSAGLATLVEAIPPRLEGRVAVWAESSGVVSLAASRRLGHAIEALWEVDAYGAGALAANHARNGQAPQAIVLEAGLGAEASDIDPEHQPGPGPRLHVTADPASGPYEHIFLVLPARGDALWARDLVEAGHDALVPGGRLHVGTDGKHHWLESLVKAVFGKAELGRVERKGRGAVIQGTRRREEPRLKDRSHTQSLERASGTVSVTTRPGTFSYGRRDRGTKALLESMALTPGMAVADLGAGTGSLGLAAAVDGGDPVWLVESDARSLALAVASARQAGLEQVRPLLRPHLGGLPRREVDLVVANPPYYSAGRIAEAFADAAARAVKPGGRVLFVAKAKELHREILEGHFRSVRVEEHLGYGILTALDAYASKA